MTGGSGRFAKILKEKNSKLNLYFASKKECNILKESSIIKIFKKVKPDIILHTAGLSRPMSIHEKDIKKYKLKYNWYCKLSKNLQPIQCQDNLFFNRICLRRKNGNYKETDPVKPFNNYGYSKLGGECSVSMYHNHLILRVTMTEKPFYIKVLIRI